MKTIYYGMMICVFSTVSNAEYIENQSPKNLYGSGTIVFGVDSPPSDTCDLQGVHFKFNATGDRGQNIFSILLSAKMAGINVNFSYTPSSTPGATKGSGCKINTLATVYDIGIP